MGVVVSESAARIDLPEYSTEDFIKDSKKEKKEKK